MATSMVRVLAVDDFESFRRFAASQLGKRPELRIVGEASDGSEAVQKAEELQPDLILLDIGLPKLNGIEAARRIRKCSPASKILFLSQDSSIETVQAALETGAVGYIVKSDGGRELLPAVDAILRGEHFIGSRFAGHDFFCHEHENGIPLMARNSQTLENFYPSNDFSLSRAKKTNGAASHKVHFYSKDASLENGLAHFIGSALKTGKAAIVVATEPHRSDLGRRLQALGLDVSIAARQGRYTAVDAAQAISTFTMNNQVDSVRFQELFADLIAQAAGARKKQAGRVAVFGECVQLMCERGNARAAIEMENLSSHLVKAHDVDMLCAYPVDQFHGQPSSEIFHRICAEHSAVYCG